MTRQNNSGVCLVAGVGVRACMLLQMLLKKVAQVLVSRVAGWLPGPSQEGPHRDCTPVVQGALQNPQTFRQGEAQRPSLHGQRSSGKYHY